MCGILSIWLASAPANDQVRQAWHQAVEAGRSRGPDSTVTHSSGNVLTSFHRLANRDTTAAGDQPFRYAGARLWCNGEIYNSEALPSADGYKPQSGSDCERILPAWEAQGRSVEKLLRFTDPSRYLSCLAYRVHR
jgi:asparagine synthetase B (glutamine-hydrolysing)